ncbi:MAG: sporulation initiation factor Spo0A C-terminal domain-containing protein [Clostridiales bacterium]|nr:sporulation initiation factor Spo0A C-terminal domain-containing protein [Clostridiales bacterium]
MQKANLEQGIPTDDISVMKDVYVQVAKSLGKMTNAVSRNAERMANLCWKMSSLQCLEQVLGRSSTEIPLSPAPKTILIYLAVYSYLGFPYF